MLGQPGDVPRRLEGRHRPRQPAHRRRARRRSTGSHDFATDDVGALRHAHRPDRAPRPRRRRTPTAGRPGRRAGTPPPSATRCSRSTTARCNRIAHMHVPWTAFRTSFRLRPATRCTRSRGRTSPAASAWSRPSPDAARPPTTGGAVRAGRLVRRLGVVPRRREAHLAAGLARSGAPHHGTDRPRRHRAALDGVRRGRGWLRPDAADAAGRPPRACCPSRSRWRSHPTVRSSRSATAARSRSATTTRPPAPAPATLAERPHPRRGATAVRPGRRDRPRHAPPVTLRPRFGLEVLLHIRVHDDLEFGRRGPGARVRGVRLRFELEALLARVRARRPRVRQRGAGARPCAGDASASLSTRRCHSHVRDAARAARRGLIRRSGQPPARASYAAGPCASDSPAAAPAPTA